MTARNNKKFKVKVNRERVLSRRMTRKQRRTVERANHRVRPL
jgi:hypothetical protein